MQVAVPQSYTCRRTGAVHAMSSRQWEDQRWLALLLRLLLLRCRAIQIYETVVYKREASVGGVACIAGALILLHVGLIPGVGAEVVVALVFDVAVAPRLPCTGHSTSVTTSKFISSFSCSNRSFFSCHNSNSKYNNK